MVQPPPGRTALYRLHDANGDLLYVGVSNDPEARWEAHARAKAWWPEVLTRTIEWFPTREEALEAETKSVHTEAPRYNRSKNPIVGIDMADQQTRLATLSQTTVAIADAEGDLDHFRRSVDGRDDMVRRARTVGLSKHRIHLLSGIARTTIDRILKEES